MGPRPARDPRPRARLRHRGVPRPPPGPVDPPAAAAPQARARAGRAARAADAGRRAHAAHAPPTSRSSSSGSRCTTSRIRKAIFTSRCSRTGRTRPGACARRRRAPRRARRRHRTPQPALRGPARRGDALPPAAPPASVERAGRQVDRLGEEARQAPRAEPAPARRRRHHVRSDPRARARGAGGVRYVITLDADTRLPMGAAYRLVGAMAHPLNRPRFDPRTGRVVEGYGVLQPRITPSLPTGPAARPTSGSSRAREASIPTRPRSPTSIRTSSSEGSYTGKGIYDVDAFETALAGKVPENTLLSHDLFERLVRARRAG